MKCFMCSHDLTEQTTKFIVDLGACVVIVKNVPALVCPACGETSYSDAVSRQLEKIVDAVRHSMISEVAIVDYALSVA